MAGWLSGELETAREDELRTRDEASMLKDFMASLHRWVEPDSGNRRHMLRTPEPSVVVYYWDGSAPEARRLRDISATGAYILTPERWYIGTIVRLILQEFRDRQST